MNPDHLIALLQKKLDFVATLANIGMTWWVSSVVFCGSILAAVWVYRKEVASSPLFVWLAAGLTYFFISIVVFGVFIVCVVNHLETEAHQILSYLKFNESFSFIEFATVRYGMVIGTTSFVVVTVAWVGLCVSIRHEAKN